MATAIVFPDNVSFTDAIHCDVISLGSVCVSQVNQEEQKESKSKIAQRRAQLASWALLKHVNTFLDLSCADVIEVQAIDAAAHIALLARQFPGVHFELAHEATPCAQSVRVLWAPDGVSEAQTTCHYQTYDAVIVTHAPEALRATLATFASFARVCGVRDIGKGQALGVFGKGLKRDLFRDRVRGTLAA
jgi:hypothetical protein